MPPANSPARQQDDDGSPPPLHRLSPSSLTVLSSFLASHDQTLDDPYDVSPAADEADEANISFLRDSLGSLEEASSPPTTRRSHHVDAARDPRQTRNYPRRSNTEVEGEPVGSARAAEAARDPEPQQQPLARVHPTAGPMGSSSISSSSSGNRDMIEDLTRRERLQRVLARLSRLHEPAAPSPNTNAYANRTPSPNRQSLYDWAPASNDNGAQQEDGELQGILDDLRRQQPDTHPNILRVLALSQMSERREQRREDNDTPAPTGDAGMSGSAERAPNSYDREQRRRNAEWVNLRRRAAIETARQGSPSATDRIMRYVIDRERNGLSEEEERASRQIFPRPDSSRENNVQDQPEAPPSRLDWTLPPPASETRQRDRQERVEAFRRGYLAENMPPRLPRITLLPGQSSADKYTTSTPFVESALKYLNDLRDCTRYEEALSTAIDHGLATKEFFADKHDDFVMNVEDIDPLPESSWLQPGAIFEGYQYASNPLASMAHRVESANAHVEQINPNWGVTPASPPSTAGSDHPPGSTRVTPFDASRPWLAHQFTPPASTAQNKRQDIQHDNWRVRVVVHGIDRAKMTLQGTMEAYDVPQHPPSHLRTTSTSTTTTPSDRSTTTRPSKRTAPITTYVDGHIIDLRTHSLLTPTPPAPSPTTTSPYPYSPPAAPMAPNRYAHLTPHITFPSATPNTDAANWRKLPPFAALASDADFARALLSRARMRAIHAEYVFMRWKERCFVHARDDACDDPQRHSGDQDRGHGLTISGFYYVSLRRRDGVVEGLYYDPSSTPFQHLRLRGRSAGWPAYELR